MSAILRVIDANANRAREGLRVLEDLARLRLSHAALSSTLKQLRHDITLALGQLPVDRGQILAWRDAANDVGTSISTASEGKRESELALAAAASSRLTESLRVLEESAKVLGASAVAGAIEQIRYRSYDATKQVELALFGGRGPQWTLCVLVTESLCTHHRWTEVVHRAIEGGADCIQLREKGLTDRELLGRAKTVVEFARRAGAAVVINDRPDIAMLANADGVHLGQTDMSIADARKVIGSSLRLGISCATIEQARAAVLEGADVCGLGPMFPSTTKPKPSLSGPDLLKAYLEDASTKRVPHLAISGINRQNIGQLVREGCAGIAVSGVVCGSEKPEEVCRELSRAIKGLGDVA
ncbi:MAG: thiamine phosphate synthase [Phycisphaerales bacterium]|nr:thiamine phosphate synthase [Phycisphaerales bacterium]